MEEKMIKKLFYPNLKISYLEFILLWTLSGLSGMKIINSIFTIFIGALIVFIFGYIQYKNKWL